MFLLDQLTGLIEYAVSTVDFLTRLFKRKSERATPAPKKFAVERTGRQRDGTWY